MANDKEFRVRRSIASSLQEIANIIEPELTENELIPVMDKLSKEEGEIQNIILKNLPKFLKHLNRNSRRNYLEKLKKLLNPREKWRSRMEYSKIIGDYYEVFDDEITYKQILPISLNFCVDDVYYYLLYNKGF
jgi:serine/threonine-protein phosphatase 4 regulatory subunit 1